MKSQEKLPEFLSSFEALQQHFRAQLDELSSTEKGKKFARFVQRIIPQTELAAEYDAPELNEKISNDGGVDLKANSRSDNSQLFIQAKLAVDRAENIDSVLSKFQAYKSSINAKGQNALFDVDAKPSKYLLVTLSPLSRIIERYENAEYSSKQFYNECKQEGRIHFIDGHKILNILCATYRKLNQLPSTLILDFEIPYIQVGNVYVGIMSAVNLREPYSSFGDALFFENVRDFSGVQKEDKPGRTNPNSEIVKTIENNPEKLLARNNGVVFGAALVKQGQTGKQLTLNNGSVVNGCQTTMCVVESNAKSGFVLVKVVQTDDAWDITKSANYQTSVPDIDLELARFLRPQLVKRAATSLGVQLDGTQRSAFQVIDEIYDRRAAYAETRLLYVGLFSRSPNNVFAANYAELLQPELINTLYEQVNQEEDIFDTLFTLQGLARQALIGAKNTFTNQHYARTFERLYREDSLAYRCFLAILALCGAINIDISVKESDLMRDVERLKAFLSESRAILKGQPQKFIKYFRMAVKIWMSENLTDESEAEVRRDMYLRSKKMNFTMMFKKLCIEADLSDKS